MTPPQPPRSADRPATSTGVRISELTCIWVLEALAHAVRELHEALRYAKRDHDFLPNFREDVEMFRAVGEELGVADWDRFVASCTTAEDRELMVEVFAQYAPSLRLVPNEPPGDLVISLDDDVELEQPGEPMDRVVAFNRRPGRQPAG